jgi:hypothetical protein
MNTTLGTLRSENVCWREYLWLLTSVKHVRRGWKAIPLGALE